MRSNGTLPLALLFLLASAILSGNAAPARAAEDDYPDEYEESARVMRVSLLRGEVSLRRAGSLDWERAGLNLPLVEGDTLATARDARLEIQVDAHNFVRLGGDSVLRVVTLREEGIALSLSEGTASVRLARFDREREYFEVDAPKTTLAAEKRGLYRLDAERDGSVRVTVREDGRARIYSENSGFVLRNNRSARLASDDNEEGDWELSQAAPFDEWDNWVGERERHLAVLLRFEDRERYYDRDIWGAEELDAYGDWSYTQQYGYVWRPHATVINNYYNWAPYRYGHWRWCPPYGWTWVGDEDWGWAPYHYGRWVYHNNYWCWAPRGYGYNYKRAWWRPALVVFVNLGNSHDRHVAWYPLTHGQRDPRGRWWNPDRDRLTPLRPREVANLRRTDPALLRAVTTLPARDFGAGGGRARPASAELAQRAVNGEPVRGRLPLVPADAGRTPSRPGARNRADPPDGGGAEGERSTLRIVRPAPVRPPREVPDRPTGAATRQPGAALDTELRRTRVFNGREPRVAPPATATEGTDRGGERDTGAVLRPPRPDRRAPVERGVTEGGGTPDNDASPAARPARPTRPAPQTGERAAPPDDAARPEPRRRPAERVRPFERGGDEGGDAPAPRVRRPSAEDRPPAQPDPQPGETRPERRERPAEPDERPQPPPRRQEPPSARPERAAPREERQSAPRQEPPARVEQPTQRQERPAPSAPQQRSEPRERPAAPARPAERPPRPRDK